MNSRLQGAVIAPLSHLGLIAARGPDTADFLQGQLSNDLRLLQPSRAQLSSYNSPKGRMLAVFHLFRDADTVFLEVHTGVLEAVLKRLRMYVLRSKVVLADVSAQRPGYGLAGPGAAALLEGAGLPVPAQVMDAVWSERTCVIRRRDAAGHARYTVHATADSVPELRDKFAARATVVEPATWRWLEIEAGVPAVYPQTSDHFVPQMCNLDSLDGISFDKGCYTGQEIVARVHYRGAVKRRMSRIELPSPPPEPGTRIAAGEVVDAAARADGTSVALVVALPAAA